MSLAAGVSRIYSGRLRKTSAQWEQAQYLHLKVRVRVRVRGTFRAEALPCPKLDIWAKWARQIYPQRLSDQQSLEGERARLEV